MCRPLGRDGGGAGQGGAKQPISDLSGAAACCSLFRADVRSPDDTIALEGILDIGEQSVNASSCATTH